MYNICNTHQLLVHTYFVETRLWQKWDTWCITTVTMVIRDTQISDEQQCSLSTQNDSFTAEAVLNQPKVKIPLIKASTRQKDIDGMLFREQSLSCLHQSTALEHHFHMINLVRVRCGGSNSSSWLSEGGTVHLGLLCFWWYKLLRYFATVDQRCFCGVFTGVAFCLI